MYADVECGMWIHQVLLGIYRSNEPTYRFNINVIACKLNININVFSYVLILGTAFSGNSSEISNRNVKATIYTYTDTARCASNTKFNIP